VVEVQNKKQVGFPDTKEAKYIMVVSLPSTMKMGENVFLKRWRTSKCWLKLIKSFCECILLRSILVMNKNNHHSQYICDFYY
jgi:hypothetical protein